MTTHGHEGDGFVAGEGNMYDDPEKARPDVTHEATKPDPYQGDGLGHGSADSPDSPDSPISPSSAPSPDRIDPLAPGAALGADVANEPDADGYYRDEFGNRVDHEGRRVDEDGNPVDASGDRIDPLAVNEPYLGDADDRDDGAGHVPPVPPPRLG